MQKKICKLFFITVFLACASTSVRAAGSGLPVAAASAAGYSNPYFTESGDKIIEQLIKDLQGKALPLGLCLAAIYSISKVQKMNPEFFSTLWRISKSPVVFAQKKLEKLFCGGESLSWNIVVSWHNRLYKSLLPLTKQASVMDLAKEKRIQVLDKTDSDAPVVDTVWQPLQAHLQQELQFIRSRLAYHVRYYQDQKEEQACSCGLCAVGGAVTTVGKTCVRLSIKRHIETAFYLKKVMAYCDELAAYISTVAHKESLDKELIKRYLDDLCSGLEHIAVLVDDTTAAAPQGHSGHLTLIRAQGNGTTGGYSGGYGGYADNIQYGSGY